MRSPRYGRQSSQVQQSYTRQRVRLYLQPLRPRRRIWSPKMTNDDLSDESSDEDDGEDDDEEEGAVDDSCNKGDMNESEGEGDSSEDEEAGEEGEEEEEEEYQVKCIHKQRGKGKNLQYYVEWEGYDERTWEPAAFLSDTLALDEWLERQRKK